MQQKVNALTAHTFGSLQPETQQELGALLLSVLDRAFRGQL